MHKNLTSINPMRISTAQRINIVVLSVSSSLLVEAGGAGGI